MTFYRVTNTALAVVAAVLLGIVNSWSAVKSNYQKGASVAIFLTYLLSLVPQPFIRSSRYLKRHNLLGAISLGGWALLFGLALLPYTFDGVPFWPLGGVLWTLYLVNIGLGVVMLASAIAAIRLGGMGVSIADWIRFVPPLDEQFPDRPSASVQGKQEPRAVVQAHQEPIFICYRRNDSADVTGRIRDRLVSEFGEDAIFTDVDTIPLGVNFRKYLDDVVARCKVLLAIVGPQWMGTGTVDATKIEDSRDFVRIEIESAL